MLLICLPSATKTFLLTYLLTYYAELYEMQYCAICIVAMKMHKTKSQKDNSSVGTGTCIYRTIRARIKMSIQLQLKA